ncbi:MAG: NAD(P)H-binding protein [Bacteroidota bacterium]|nr:NAD(P)H-binding protein [Bacteroidota bacterium]
MPNHSLLIFGASGMIGSEFLTQALADEEINRVTVILRKEIDIQHPKLRQIIHRDFLDYQNLINEFKSHTACIWALGISQTQVGKEDYIKITYDYTIQAAKAMLKVNPEMHFLFISGLGADVKEKSFTLFGRIKGRTEKVLSLLGCKRLLIVRPGGVQASKTNNNEPFLHKFISPFYTILNKLVPSLFITSNELAKVGVHILKNDYQTGTFSNNDLRKIMNNNLNRFPIKNTWLF